MKRIFLMMVLTAILLFGTIFCSMAQRKESKIIEVKAGEKKNPEEKIIDIIVPKGKNIATNPVPQINRGDAYNVTNCNVIIENWTGWYIDFYIDGEYRGSIAPWDIRVSWVIVGPVKLYAEADGTMYFWGPTSVDCNYTFTWKLNP